MAFDRQLYSDLYPFDPHWLTLQSGERMHFVDEGPRDAPVLLFVHGNPTWSFHWRRLLQSFAGEYRVIAVDHIGSGLSDKPQRDLRLSDHAANLREFLSSLGVSQYTLIAQDWGGAIGLAAAVAEPRRLARIVLFNTAAFPPPYIPWRISLCRLPGLGAVALQGLNVFSRAALSMTLNRREKLDTRVADAYLAPYDNWQHRRGVRGFVDDIPGGENHPTWKTLQQLGDDIGQFADRESLLVWGMKDWCFRPECLDRFEAAWPQAEVHRLADVGHWVVEDADEQVAELMQAFLHRTERVASEAG